MINLFFTISGIYTSLQLIPKLETTQLKIWKFYTKIFNLRQDQTFALNVVFLYIFSSIFPQLSLAPFWYHSTYEEMKICRKNWRFNLISLQNYFSQSEMCLESSWILAAELHLILLAVAILYLVKKFPRCNKLFFGLCLMISFGIIAWKIFILRLPIVALITPRYGNNL